MKSKFNAGKKAFTLAEVLITLGIIGIVAAMTMPSLIQNYKKKEYSARLKKFYSTMQQAIKLSEIENGPAAGWVAPSSITDPQALQQYWETYFAKYFRNAKLIDDFTQDGQTRLIFQLSDGTLLSISRPNLNSSFQLGASLHMKFNNGNSTLGKDRFVFLLTKDGKFIPYFWDQHVNDENAKLDKDEEKFTTNSRDRANVLRLCKVNHAMCTQLLFLDNWEFKDDYPLKL